jgi:riboflavin synthase
MFTGIVSEQGRIESIEETGEGARLRVRAPETTAETRVGDSVAVSGVCLTAIEAGDGKLAFDVIAESLRRSTLGLLVEGGSVNLELPLQAGDRVGGHFVQGHVDGIGRVRRVTEEGLEIEASPEILRYCVEKGSIAVDGVSLTIAWLDEEAFAVALIPHTKEVTTLGRLAPGDAVNLEVDMLAKHLEKLVAPEAE